MLKTVFALFCAASVLTLPMHAAGKKAVVPPEMAGSKAPYSPGILVDGTLYIAGETGADLKTNQYPSNFEDEVKNSLERIGLILKAAGMSFDNVVSSQVFLTDMDLFQRMNAVYVTYVKDPKPARATIGVAKLAAPGAHIEIMMIAHK
jgi:2-iminobutanoate/2-iminopropanoate deaminase